MKKNPIKWQLFVGCAVAALIPSFILFFYYLNIMSVFYRREVQTAQETELNTINYHLSSILKQADDILESTANMIVISRPFSDYDNKTSYEKLQVRKSIENELVNRSLTYTAVDNIFVETFNGDVFSPHDSEVDPESFREFVGSISPDQAGKNIVLSTHDVYYSTSGRVISFQRYLNKYTPGSAAALIQADISLKSISDAVDVDADSGSYVLILDGNGDYIYCPDENYIGRPADCGNLLPIDYDKLIETKKYHGNGVSVLVSTLAETGWNVVEVNNDNAYRNAMASARRTWLLVSCISLAIALSVGLLISANINSSLLAVINAMQKAAKGNFQISQDVAHSKEFSNLIVSFNEMVTRIDALMTENVKKEHEKTVLELSALSSKINSHFLYNTLNLVKLLAIKNKQRDIAEIIVALCGILEYSYKDTDTMVPLSLELDFVKKYHYIQTTRLGKNVTLDINVSDEASLVKVPKIIIQPIVENSIMHAFPYEEDHGHTIVINGHIIDGSRIELIISDDGCGFQYTGLENMSGTGLTNIKHRLELFYGNWYQFIINSEPGKGTKTIFVLPKDNADEQ